MAKIATAIRSSSAPICGGLANIQLDALQHLVTKHVKDAALADITSKTDFSVTSTERGVLRWEHAHIIAALDVLNTYQTNRSAKSRPHILGCRIGMRSQYTNDPRTKMVELLKRWLRTNAASAALEEDDVRCMSSLCRDVLNHPNIFPSRNKISFMSSIAEVYHHLQLQLREVLERDRTCADLAKRALSLSRNLIADALSYLLLAPTDLKQTDKLPSVEVVALWQCLPSDSHPLPNRVDKKLQDIMQSAWNTPCGALIAALLRTPWCVRLFDGAGAQEEAAAAAIADTSCSPPIDALKTLLQTAKESFNNNRCKNSGLAGVLRKSDAKAAREGYLKAVELVFELMYLLGEALVQFHRVSDGLGDYGMIRIAPWLHPFLEALADKVQRLKKSLKDLHDALDKMLVVPRARGQSVEKPVPSNTMNQRAHAAIERAIVSRENHAQSLLQALDELRSRSAPERLPHLMEGLGDACMQLQGVLTSPQFLECVGTNFPPLPPLCPDAVPEAPCQQARSTAKALPDLDNRSPPLEIDADLGAAVPTSSFTVVATGAAIPTVSTGAAVPVATGDVQLRWVSEPAIQEPTSLTSSFASSMLSGADRNLDKSIAQVTPRKQLAPAPLALKAEVYRLTTHILGGWRRHDRRCLWLDNGTLKIGCKGSMTQVKSTIPVQEKVDDCSCLGESTMRLVLSMVPDMAAADSGVMEHKVYYFEFLSKHSAATFYSEIAKLCANRLGVA